MNNHFVINIGRQLGSGGKAVGEVLARRFGIQIYDKRLIKLAAEQSGLGAEFFEKADEKPQHTVSTLIGYLRNPFAGELTLFDNPLSRDALFKAQSDAIRDLAARESCIFVGRCADYVLRDHPHCVNLFISAPDATRVQRLMHDRQIDEAEAARLVASDDSRAAYYNHFSNRTWGMASTYHLCIDSSVLGIEGTADLAEHFIRRKLSDIL